ncbi:ABC transporter substrate-binding protein [Blautia producta]|uniref:Extracellular solute-binding protein n=2 Tax=Blautia producta TaxID=33035 RepID=A0A7G5MQH4_9FIRM|nr:extracellular solute-binding protein [Blautia producta]QIB55273.1 extracellular solute-binding protein [Blautia producta ATCC 27340 = DSM 2950]QMW76867.1 extracellular solute-binding protein [Blautia producta]
MKKKFILAMLTATVTAAALAGCGQKDNSTNNETISKSDDGKVTIKVFSNLPDRKNGQGLVEQKIIDEYMEENQNVEIKVEALDEEAYKTKFKAYSMEGMPDVVSIWGQPSFLDEVLDAGVLAELNEDDYADYKFVSGSLDGFKKDGKLYGLPRNTDVAGFYYNEKMFTDNGWEIPKTYDELLTLAGKIKESGMVPLAMDGGDGWPMAVYLSDILFKLAGDDYAGIVSDAVSNADFSNPSFIEATQLLKKSADEGLFQNGYDSQDYGTAMNLFTNGQAAMFYMGSWEASMALNEDISEEIRDNIRVFTMPVIEGGKGTATDIAAWNGGGYAVAESSEVKEEAIKFLNYMYQPDKLSKYGWENGVGMSAQDQSEYMTGNETKLQMQFVDAVNAATSLSGTPINDCGPSAFKTSIESEIQSVSNGSTSVDDFLSTIGASCK